MRFPLGLAANLYRQKFQRDPSTTPILRLSPLINHAGRILRQEQVTPDLEWHTPEACVAAANRVAARIVWLGHGEPLLHPNIGQVVAALLGGGRYVFLHTSGFALRRRIHEFQPDSCLFLTVEVVNHADSSPLASAPRGVSRSFLEAIDCARLSGFYRCAHVTVGAQADAAETGRLFEWLEAKGLEGLVASPSGSLTIAADRATQRKLAEIRKVIPSRGWREFSRLLEESRLMLEEPRLADVSAVDREPVRPGSGICEESALSQ